MAETASAQTTQQTIPVAAIRAQQNIGLAVVAGLGAALICAIIWAVITVITKMELGLIAVALGYIVGQAVRAAGKGIDQQFGVVGAACALLGCVLGNVLSALAFYAQGNGLDFSGLMAQLSPDLVVRTSSASFQAMDIVFYGIAIYEGYRFSFRYKLQKPAPAPAAKP
jgi:hypothetical protein